MTLLFRHNNDFFQVIVEVIIEVKEKPKTTTVLNHKNVNTSVSTTIQS